MTNFFLRILGFVLGIKHKTPEERAASGQRLITEAIIAASSSLVNSNDVRSIWRLGSIDFDVDLLNRSKRKLLNDEHVEFSAIENFDLKNDFIDFYQIETVNERYFIIALSDTFALSKENHAMFLIEIRDPYPTANLKISKRYYPYN
jgi:hypothetical protein